MKNLSLLIFILIYFCPFTLNAQQEFSKIFPIKSDKRSEFRLPDKFAGNPTTEIVDSILEYNMSYYHIPGIQALIVKHDEVVWSKNYGYTNLASSIPVEDTTLFLMASISKTIMATAIMQLWEDGLFELDDNINNYLLPEFQVINPNFPGDSITFKMLMTHCSSIDDDWNILTPLESCGDSPISLGSFESGYYSLGGQYYSPLNFFNYSPTAGNYHYTNAGSSILAYLVEKLSGQSYNQYCRDNIFDPIGMNRSALFLDGLDTSNIAIPYEWSSNHYFAYCHQDWPLYPIAFLRTNKIELERFLSLYRNYGTYNNITLLDSATVSLMLSDQIGYPDPYGDIQGLIWYQANNVYDHSMWGHTGGWLGASTAMFYDKDEDWGIIYFMNAYPESNGFWSTAKVLGDYARVYGQIYATNVTVDTTYLPLNSNDTIKINAEYHNINNQNFTTNAIFVDSDNSYVDSIALYDDGLHGDSLADDGIWGGFITNIPFESIFNVGTSTTDLQTGEYFRTNGLCTFATAGPIEVDSIEYTHIPQLKRYSIKAHFRNDGNQFAIETVQAFITCDDPWLVNFNNPNMNFPTIQPGAIVSSTGSSSLVYSDSTFPGYFNLKFKILSNGVHFWNDSIVFTPTLVGIEKEESTPANFVLDQNYPNPFNPSTKISWQLPSGQKVTLKILNLLGKEVTSLIDEYKPAGVYETEFNASNLPSGVYFYRLQAGPFVQTRKMILLK